MKDWLSNIKVLWSIIIALGGALTGFIIYNQTLMNRIDILTDEVTKVDDKMDVIENSYLKYMRQSIWDLQDSIHIISLKIKGE